MMYLLFIFLLIFIFYKIFHYLEGNLDFQLDNSSKTWDFGSFQPKVTIAGNKILISLFGVIIASNSVSTMKQVKYEVVGNHTAKLLIGNNPYLGSAIWVPKINRSVELVDSINSYIGTKLKTVFIMKELNVDSMGVPGCLYFWATDFMYFEIMYIVAPSKQIAEEIARSYYKTSRFGLNDTGLWGRDLPKRSFSTFAKYNIKQGYLLKKEEIPVKYATRNDVIDEILTSII